MRLGEMSPSLRLGISLVRCLTRAPMDMYLRLPEPQNENLAWINDM